MDADEIRTKFELLLPGWDVHSRKSGVGVWADVTLGDLWFSVAFHPELGFGVSKMERVEELAFMHDEGFDSLEEVVGWIKSQAGET